MEISDKPTAGGLLDRFFKPFTKEEPVEDPEAKKEISEPADSQQGFFRTIVQKIIGREKHERTVSNTSLEGQD